ncbi:MAG: ribulose-phosphate 3-epimerase [Spirochaetes bacterium]|nr:ribulose-phosphate 3-epimerase [Spirochaetota bacterium]
MKKAIVSPSLLAADFADFGGALKIIEAAGASWAHLDVMDGHFVPNLTFGWQLVKSLRGRSALFLDVHLMVADPGRFIRDFAEAGADGITFHAEAAVHSAKLLSEIKALGKKAGISVVPSTPVSMLEELLPMADLVLVMTVNPGFGGQVLIPGCLEKVKKLAAIRQERGLDFLISVDGGINGETALQARSLGADVLVMGSSFFGAEDQAAIVKAAGG